MTQSPPKVQPFLIEVPNDGKPHELFRISKAPLKFPLAQEEQAFFDRAKQHFLTRRTGVLSDSVTQICWDSETATAALVNFGIYVGHDFKHGVRFRYAAVRDIGLGDGFSHFLRNYPAASDRFLAECHIGLHSPERGISVNPDELTLASRVLLYTDRIHLPVAAVSEACRAAGINVDLIVESELLKSAFISYGGPDALVVGKINDYLRSRGVKTWFFPRDAIPGQKLHRVMYEGVHSHDRVLLMCSKTSLSRPGVLNELEHVLAREANEGGSDVLIPVALDDYVHSDWAPQRPDLAQQVQSRVIAQVDVKAVLKLRPGVENEDLERVVAALTGPA